MTFRIRLAASLLLLLPSTLAAQTKPALAFEVATIKPSDPDKTSASLMMSQGRLEVRNQSLGALIKFAYGLSMGTDEQLSGGPKWLSTAKFDIDAKEDEETAAALKAMPREESTRAVRQMVVALLADRFGLVVHKESKVLPVYALVPAKGGAKMTESSGITPASGAKDPRTWSGIRGARLGDIEAHNCTMDIFVGFVAGQPEAGGRVVVNQTNLPGKFDFTLKWTPEPAPGAAPSGPATDSTAPLFLTALQEQLGLKLDSTHAPVDTIVVDSATLPTSN
jgi:uncharacterized protein (TIGR03435 family)